MKRLALATVALSFALLGPEFTVRAGTTTTPAVQLEYRVGHAPNLHWMVNALAGDEHTESAAYQKF